MEKNLFKIVDDTNIEKLKIIHDNILDRVILKFYAAMNDIGIKLSKNSLFDIESIKKSVNTKLSSVEKTKEYFGNLKEFTKKENEKYYYYKLYLQNIEISKDDTSIINNI
jgi:hypothetical protein